MRLLVSNVVCLPPAHRVKCIISVKKTLIEHFKKFSFNGMLSMIHYAGAMHEIIEGDHFLSEGQYFNTVMPLDSIVCC